MENPAKPPMKTDKEQDPASWHEERIARMDVKYPLRGYFLNGSNDGPAIEKLKNKFGYTQSDILDIVQDGAKLDKEERN